MHLKFDSNINDVLIILMIEGDIHCLLVADIHVRFCDVLVYRLSKLKELVDQTRATLTSMMYV